MKINKSKNIIYIFNIKTFQLKIFLFLETYFFTFFNNKNISAFFKKNYMKKNKKLFTLLKSPHVNKKSRDQLFFIQYIGSYSLYLLNNYIFGQSLKVFSNQKNISIQSDIKYNI